MKVLVACEYSGAVRDALEELGSMSKDDKQAWWSMCQYKVKTGSWTEKRALANYRERHGVWPRGLSDAPLPPTRAFESFAIRSIRKYLKGKR